MHSGAADRSTVYHRKQAGEARAEGDRGQAPGESATPGTEVPQGHMASPWVVRLGDDPGRRPAPGPLPWLRGRNLILLCLCVVLFMFWAINLRPAPTGAVGAGRGGAGLKFAVVFDAGSTGSRVHAYKFRTGRGADMDLVDDTFVELKPGLSSYGGRPAEAVASLQPLMRRAIDAVPAGLRASTPVELRATAGLRLLPGDQAREILDAVLEALVASPFSAARDSVSILDGQDEGAYGWLTLNYLLGRLGRGHGDTATAVDLGGGSVQVSYAVSPEQARGAPDGYIKRLSGGGAEYSVYVHSYLRFGLMAARAEILKGGGGDGGSPCVARGFSGEYKYGNDTLLALPAKDPEGVSGLRCRELVVDVLELDKPCPGPQGQCSFQGAWGGPGRGRAQPVFLFSYFWDRALDSSIIGSSEAISWQSTPGDYAGKSDAACKMDMGLLASSFPDVAEDRLPYLCMDLSFCSVLLSDGIGLGGSQGVNLVKQVLRDGKKFEMAWALGAAINSISALHR